ncbi:uncharacterized protein LOC126971348 isoform X2 [Leptidea sinapis]|nr:uncharacterized protein LOC126971348 isoform X2 [Leptidea sinapis]
MKEESDPEYDETTQTVSKDSSPQDVTENYDVIQFEVPIVNVSGELGFGEDADMDDLFNIMYEVTPRKDVTYDTTVLPLLQFSIKNPYDALPPSNRLEELRLKKNTHDARLTYSTANTRKLPRKYYGSTKRLKFRKKYKPVSTEKQTYPEIYKHMLSSEKQPPLTTAPKVLPTMDNKFLSMIYNNTANRNNDSWNFIYDVIQKVSISTTETSTGIPAQDLGTLDLFLKGTISAYRAPTRMLGYETSGDGTRKDYSTASSASESGSSERSSTSAINEMRRNIEMSRVNNNDTTARASLMNTTMSSDSDDAAGDALNTTGEDYEDIKVYFTESESSTETASLVNHKSFENVVKAAPVMAGLLNTTPVKNEKALDEHESVQQTVRKKRYLQALQIEEARPRNVTSASLTKTTRGKVYMFSDMQDLAQFVELQDDEIEGRVGLRYLRKYVGSPVFNICDFHEPKSRQVHLFNLSRIVIAISNFTLDRMTIVATPARTLLHAAVQCPRDTLECQVAGTRVCIDSTNACDGVPNCGTHDIYDEDRLKCGLNQNLQHNVYLAACTFLAVLLTALYTVHYWLKRWVPKVSEAFFVYSETSENILYLDSIMRSPNENEDDCSKLFYQAGLFDEDEFLNEDNRTFFMRMKRLISKYLFCKKDDESIKKKNSGELQSVKPLAKKMFSFTELELRNFSPAIKDTAVQTGLSLEIPNPLRIQSRKERSFEADVDLASIKSFERDSNTEINVLKLFKGLRHEGSLCSVSNSLKNTEIASSQLDIKLTHKHETELLSTEYDQNVPSTSRDTSKAIPVAPVVQCEIDKDIIQARKQLRFDEEITTIQSELYDDDDSTNVGSVMRIPISRQETMAPIAVEEISSNSGRDFMRFWRVGKNKKLPKKT